MSIESQTPLQIREHPLTFVIGCVLAVSGLGQVVLSAAGPWSTLWQLWIAALGVALVLRWKTSVVEVYAGRVQLRSMFRAQTILIGSFAIVPAFQKVTGQWPECFFPDVAGFDVDGCDGIVYPTVAVSPTILQRAIEEAQGLIPPSKQSGPRWLFGADYRHGRVEGWLRAKVL